MNRLLEIINKINIKAELRTEVDMSKYTTFKCGGTAEIFIEPDSIEDLLKVKKACNNNNIPLFILGGGANILVSDKGIPGVTLSLSSLNKIETKNDEIIAYAGATVNSVSEKALDKSLSGLEFIYGMPGSIGGAAYMNARCYGDEISEHFLWAEYINSSGELKKIEYNSSEWDYKISPLQKDGIIITKIALQLKNGNKPEIEKIMHKNRQDRRDKGHFKYPCAGSVFKNNREFGAPSGKIIEEAGLKGKLKGDAQISTFHGNIIVNLGKAKASDINYLIEYTIKEVEKQTGLILEPEVLKVGNWEA